VLVAAEVVTQSVFVEIRVFFVIGVVVQVSFLDIVQSYASIRTIIIALISPRWIAKVLSVTIPYSM
jgi:hypothetical protein